MSQAISATEANRKFSEILRHVREGETYVVTSHGKPVARIVPAGPNDEAIPGAKEPLLAHLREQSTMDIGTWTRDELYEDEE